VKNMFCQVKTKVCFLKLYKTYFYRTEIETFLSLKFKFKNIKEKQDLCQDFGSSVPDSRCGRKIYVEILNIITSFCVLKSIDINKANKAKNIRYNIKFTFPHRNKQVAKTKCI
jgi:hypothetical protein